jgi:adenylylsulfate kinase
VYPAKRTGNRLLTQENQSESNRRELSAERRRGLTVWFTGLSGAGKTTICERVRDELIAQGYPVEVLDGDSVRKHLCRDLGFSEADRKENIRRIAEVAGERTQAGSVVLVAAISPYRSSREEVRTKIRDFFEVYVNAPLPVCEARDPKGLYQRARSGMIQHFTGIDDPYEPPTSPEVECYTDLETVQQSAEKVLAPVLFFLTGGDISRETRRVPSKLSS